MRINVSAVHEHSSCKFEMLKQKTKQKAEVDI